MAKRWTDAAAVSARRLKLTDHGVLQATKEYLAQHAPELLAKYGIDRAKREADRARAKGVPSKGGDGADRRRGRA